VYVVHRSFLLSVQWVPARPDGVGVYCLQSTNTLLSRRAWRDTLRMRKASGVAAVTYDWRRTGRYMTFGLLDGTCSHYWFEALDGFLRRSFPAAAGVQETALACTFDVVFFTPLWTAAFLSYMSLSAGVGTSPCLGPLPPAAASQLRSLSLSLHETLTRAPTCAGARGTLAGLRDNWRSLYSGNVAAWVPLNAVIYGVVPLEERVLAFATFTLAYTVVLSVWLDAVGRDSPTTASDDTRQ
jgi:hypothetical protein